MKTDQRRVTWEGGCHCGALRYRIDGPCTDAGYCHCGICRRPSAAPVQVWASFDYGPFRYTRGKPQTYRSSHWGQRDFCPRCGTQIGYRVTENPRSIDINVGNLDDPEAIRPPLHIYAADRLSWFDTADTLPRYDAEGPQPEQQD